MFIKPNKDRNDKWGSGAFNSKRGKRKHNGKDIPCPEKSICISHIAGEVTKLGYPYSDDLSFRYVEITDFIGRRHRFFYVNPKVIVGQSIVVGEEIGLSQRLGDRYEGITEHVHYEIKDKNGKLSTLMNISKLLKAFRLIPIIIILFFGYVMIDLVDWLKIHHKEISAPSAALFFSVVMLAGGSLKLCLTNIMGKHENDDA